MCPLTEHVIWTLPLLSLLELAPHWRVSCFLSYTTLPTHHSLSLSVTVPLALLIHISQPSPSSFKQANNLCDLIVHSFFLKSTSQTGTFPSSRSQCCSCPYLTNTTILTSTSHCLYQINDSFTCTSTFLNISDIRNVAWLAGLWSVSGTLDMAMILCYHAVSAINGNFLQTCLCSDIFRHPDYL